LSRLLGKRVTAKRAGPTKMVAAVSTYISIDNQLAAACAFDLEFANYAGAALAMVPSAIATEAIRIRKIEEEALENLREVANIMASLFNGPNCHIKLRDMHKTPPTPELVALAQRPARRVDLDIDITSYGAGKIVIFYTAPPFAG
jgi:hypothetical protein